MKHGGRTPRGVESPKFKSGKGSRFVPDRFLDAFTSSISDPEYLSLRRQMALTDAREVELLERFESGESGEQWANVAEALTNYEQAVTRDDPRASEFLSALKSAVASGIADEHTWRELAELFETRRKLADTERKRIESAQAYMTAEEIGVVGGYFAALLKKYVAPERLAEAGEEMAQFFSAWRAGEKDEMVAGRNNRPGRPPKTRRLVTEGSGVRSGVGGPESGAESGVGSGAIDGLESGGGPESGVRSDSAGHERSVAEDEILDGEIVD